MSELKKPNFTPFKFREILVYGSTEWMADSKKKYQRVFEKMEISYIYCEFSFFNKLFDEEEWEVKVNLKCYSMNPEFVKVNEMCNIEIKRKVKIEENVVFIREGWGNVVKGQFWQKGRYMFEAYLDDKLIGHTYFYVEHAGSVTEEENPYLKVSAAKLFEGGLQVIPQDQRKFFTQFDNTETRYVWGQIDFENIRKNEEWYCEVFFSFYNQAHQLKGKSSEIYIIKPDRDTFQICSGWGSESKGSWFSDSYTLEIVFMNHLLAIIPFEVGEGNVVGDPEILKGGLGGLTLEKPLVVEETLEEILAELDALIGLKGIKNRMRELYQQLNFMKLRKVKGLEEEDKISLHTVFTGNPGTGKTTVAKLLGKIYHKLGLLSKGHVHEVDRAELVGEYIGQTAPKVREAIAKSRGGILFIDEAYALARSGEDSKDYGREVIEMLIKEMSDGKGDLAVIVAGYPREMSVFLDSNPGIKSRFSHYFDFPDYVPQELMEIARYSMSKKKVRIDPQAEEFLYTQIVEGYRNRDKSFGNARWVNSIMDGAKLNLGLRIMKSDAPSNLSEEILSTISLSDLEEVFKKSAGIRPDIPIDEELLREALYDLDRLTGLDLVKKEVQEMVDLVRFYREIGKDVLNSFSLHTVFTGNPGTGKTTVARIMARLFKALGVLEKGHLVECGRQDLVAGFVGQTALKTTEIIDKALGGLLFIDEAYSLTQGGNSDFGKEAVETLLKKMEDLRGQFVVVVAGYPENMRVFLESNPGLRSRFDKTLLFEDYTPTQLWEIALNLFSGNKLILNAEAEAHLKKYITWMYNNKDKYFGNARLVRKLVDETVKNQNLRMARMEKSLRTPEVLNALIFQDVEEFELGRGIESSSKIGFGMGGRPEPDASTN